MATASGTPTSRSIASDEDILASLRASTGTIQSTPGAVTSTSIPAALPVTTATAAGGLPWPYYDYSDSNGHLWTVSDPDSSVSYVNRTSDVFEDSCNTESWTATGLDQQVILVPVGASARVVVNSADNFKLFLAAPRGGTFNVSYIYMENNEGPAEYEQFNMTVNPVAQTAPSLLPCGLQLTRRNLTSDSNVTIATISVAPIASTEVLYVLNMTLADDPSANNGSSAFAGGTNVESSGSTSQPVPESNGFPIMFVAIPLAVVSVILLAGLAWFLLRRRRRRRAASGKSSQKRYTALSDFSNSSVALSMTIAVDSRRTSATVGTAPPPSVTGRSVGTLEDGYQASEFIRSSSHEPSSPGHSYATLDPALGRRQSLQSNTNSYSTFSHPDMARRPGSDFSHGLESYTMRDSLASEDPFADTVSDSGTAVSTKGLVRDKG